MRKIINKIQKVLKRRFQSFCAENKYLSVIYYLLLDSSFSREQQAVLMGLVKHKKEVANRKSNYFLLVRNIHRIEKGLLMRPRRDVFGLSYIEETISSFEGIWVYSEIKNNPQMKWFHDVLSQYFSVVNTENEIISSCKKRFIRKIDEEFKKENAVKENFSDGLSSPYHRINEKYDLPSFEVFYNLTRHRRSVRWFTDKKVPHSLIDKAISAAIQSPSACNRQPFTFKVIDDPDKVNQVTQIPMGTRGYHFNIKTFVVVVGDLKAYFHERDRHNIYVDGSLAAMSFMLALETLGLSSCPINWPDIEKKENQMASLLNLQKYQRPILCICVGYPDPEGKVGYSEKRPINTIREYI